MDIDNGLPLGDFGHQDDDGDDTDDYTVEKTEYQGRAVRSSGSKVEVKEEAKVRVRKRTGFRLKGQKRAARDMTIHCIAETCTRTFSSSAAMILHFTQQHCDGKGGKKGKKQELSCPLCDYTTMRTYNLARHLEHKHTSQSKKASVEKGKSFLCDYCGRGFRTKSNQQKHMAVVHRKEKNYMCDVCAASFSNSSSLKRHSQRCANRTCHLCQRLLNIHCSLEKHLKSCPMNPDIAQTKRFPCPWEGCDAVFSMRKIMKAHYRARHTDQRYMCSSCGTAFRYPAGLFRHRCPDTRANEGPIPCQVPNCQRRFDCKKKMKRHFTHIHVPRSYPCPTCGMAFRWHTSMKRHALRNTCSATVMENNAAEPQNTLLYPDSSVVKNDPLDPEVSIVKNALLDAGPSVVNTFPVPVDDLVGHAFSVPLTEIENASENPYSVMSSLPAPMLRHNTFTHSYNLVGVLPAASQNVTTEPPVLIDARLAVQHLNIS
jgi:hypothetical protein